MIKWLPIVIALICIWLSFLLKTPFSPDSTLKYHLLLSPIYILLTFGLISLIILFYRVFTFNDCKDAFFELQQEIKEAKESLKQQGYKFNEAD